MDPILPALTDLFGDRAPSQEELPLLLPELGERGSRAYAEHVQYFLDAVRR